MRRLWRAIRGGDMRARRDPLSGRARFAYRPRVIQRRFALLLALLLSLCGCPPDDPCTDRCTHETDPDAFARCLDVCEHLQPRRSHGGET
jgi:hypothetical protein